MTLDEKLGYCGLYCGGCAAYQRTIAGESWEYAPGSAGTCRGCESGELSPWCGDCAIKVCARGRGHRFCLECEAFPCDQMQAFMDDPQYPYHKDVPAAMARLKEIGLAAWSAEQDARWNCPRCGVRFDWFARSCPGCGGAVN